MDDVEHTEEIDLSASIHPLRAARRRLKSIPDDELDVLPPEKRREWARQVQTLSVAITKLETADLQNLADEFVAKEPQLRAAATKLDEDLNQLTDAIAMITVASAAVKTVTDIVSLLA